MQLGTKWRSPQRKDRLCQALVSYSLVLRAEAERIAVLNFALCLAVQESGAGTSPAEGVRGRNGPGSRRLGAWGSADLVRVVVGCPCAATGRRGSEADWMERSWVSVYRAAFARYSCCAGRRPGRWQSSTISGARTFASSVLHRGWTGG